MWHYVWLSQCFYNLSIVLEWNKRYVWCLIAIFSLFLWLYWVIHDIVGLNDFFLRLDVHQFPFLLELMCCWVAVRSFWRKMFISWVALTGFLLWRVHLRIKILTNFSICKLGGIFANNLGGIFPRQLGLNIFFTGCVICGSLMRILSLAIWKWHL